METFFVVHPNSQPPNDAVQSPVRPVVETALNSKDSADTGLAFPRPTFSLGLTQDDLQLNKPVVPDVHNGDEDDLAPPFRKSKRPRVVPRSLVGDYQCSKRILTRTWESHVNATRVTNIDYAAKFAELSVKLESAFSIKLDGLSLSSKELSAIVARTSHLPAKVLDVLIRHTSSVFTSHPDLTQSKNSVFMDTKFVSLLAKTFAKFSKSSKSDTFRFPPALVGYLAGDTPIAKANRFYFPFNFDKKHWVGVYVDSSLSQVLVLDSNTSLRTDGMIMLEMRSISQMFPHILRQAGKQLSSKDMKPFNVERPRGIPQNTSTFDSGIISILLIQAHAIGGVEVCKCITPDVLDVEVERLAVMI